MAEFRTIRMSFWNDPFIEELDPETKLLYLYLFTCQHTNNLGILEITVKRIAFETGLTVNTVSKGIDTLSKTKKLVTYGNLIWLVKFIKNQTTTSEKLVQSLRALMVDVDPKLRHIICMAYPHIFEGMDTASEGYAQGMDRVSEGYIDGIDTVHIPSGEKEEEKEREEEREYTHPSDTVSLVKETYGELKNVKLTKMEYGKLIARLGGESPVRALIDKLDRYIASKGKDKYKSHYATMLDWAERDKGTAQGSLVSSASGGSYRMPAN